MDLIKNNKGLTLVETVIALTLVVVLTTAFAGSIVTGLKSEKITKNLDLTVDFSASFFDFFNQRIEKKSRFYNYVLKSDYFVDNIDFSDQDYNDSLKNFKNHINNSDFNKYILKPFIDNSNYDLDTDKTEITIKKIDEDKRLYRVILNIVWGYDNRTGNYTTESIIGGSYE
jgi:type II secretory pathway pseudopilin PulG